MHKVDITKQPSAVGDPLAVVCLRLGAHRLEGIGGGLVAVYDRADTLMGFVPVWPDDGKLVQLRVGKPAGKPKAKDRIYLAFQEMIPAMEG